VYAGIHRFVPGLKAAVKVLHPNLSHLEEVLKELRRKAELLARLRHPHIVRVLDFIEEGELAALVVEFVQGRTLTECLPDRR
jgi:serine/threonine-protein kinase